MRPEKVKLSKSGIGVLEQSRYHLCPGQSADRRKSALFATSGFASVEIAVDPLLMRYLIQGQRPLSAAIDVAGKRPGRFLLDTCRNIGRADEKDGTGFQRLFQDGAQDLLSCLFVEAASSKTVEIELYNGITASWSYDGDGHKCSGMDRAPFPVLQQNLAALHPDDVTGSDCLFQGIMRLLHEQNGCGHCRCSFWAEITGSESRKNPENIPRSRGSCR